MAVTVAGSPMCFAMKVGRIPKRIVCPGGKEITVQSLGPNTLWLSFDGGATELFVACGTSFDQRLDFEEVLVRTKIGETSLQGMVTS
jgi:hypothetical protein